MAAHIFLGLAWPLLGIRLCLPWLLSGSGGALPPDSHVLEQMLRALHQDDAVERGVFTHHATGAVSAHHELQ